MRPCFPNKGYSHTFCELAARFKLAKSDDGSTVPRKIDLYWFMPAFANSRVGSERGTTEEDGTTDLKPDQLGETLPIPSDLMEVEGVTYQTYGHYV